jgi:hypothetical protein
VPGSVNGFRPLRNRTVRRRRADKALTRLNFLEPPGNG